MNITRIIVTDCRTRKNRDENVNHNKNVKAMNDSDPSFCKFCDSNTCHKKNRN